MNAYYEQLIAHKIARIVPDLRLIDLSHYVCYLHQERYGNIADLVDGVCNMHFHPLTLRFANRGDFSLNWGHAPTVRLLMEFSNLGLSASFYLTLKSTCFSVALQQIRHKNRLDMAEQEKADCLNLALSDAKFSTDPICTPIDCRHENHKSA